MQVKIVRTCGAKIQCIGDGLSDTWTQNFSITLYFEKKKCDIQRPQNFPTHLPIIDKNEIN